jgi:5-enolpyruvylshikimate-3-phosphate synthase
MTYEKLETLSRIYNTLLLINTKGEDTLVMADCLNAMRAFIQNEQREMEVAMNTKATPEEV